MSYVKGRGQGAGGRGKGGGGRGQGGGGREGQVGAGGRESEGETCTKGRKREDGIHKVAGTGRKRKQIASIKVRNST